jgi:hypothetical protein
VDGLVEGALDLRVFANLFCALVAEGVAAGQGERLLVFMIVALVADLTFKYRFHIDDLI